LPDAQAGGPHPGRLRRPRKSVGNPPQFRANLQAIWPSMNRDGPRHAFNKQVFSDGSQRAKAATSNQSLAATVRVGIFERQFACQARKFIFTMRMDCA
jgi:hypothetical protein